MTHNVAVLGAICPEYDELGANGKKLGAHPWVLCLFGIIVPFLCLDTAWMIFWEFLFIWNYNSLL
jgi:hypothetical protein